MVIEDGFAQATNLNLSTIKGSTITGSVDGEGGSGLTEEKQNQIVFLFKLLPLLSTNAKSNIHVYKKIENVHDKEGRNGVFRIKNPSKWGFGRKTLF